MQMAHHYQYILDSYNRVLDKVHRGDYYSREFAKEHQRLLSKSARFLQQLEDHREYFSVKEELYNVQYIRPLFRFICTAPQERIIVTCADDKTCVLLRDKCPMKYAVPHKRDYGTSCIYGGQDSSTNNAIFRKFDSGKGKHVLFTTDRYAARVLKQMNPAFSITVVNYDTKTHGPVNLHKPASDYFQDCDERRKLDKLSAKFKNLKSSFENLLVLQRRAETVAATTIGSWWRRLQLAQQHRAANVIQQRLRPVLYRISAKRDQAAARRNQAAKSIQVWRRNLVLQRRNRRLAAAALSSPFRDRGIKLPPRNKSTRRRHKRREEGPKIYSEEELQPSVQKLQDTVQSLQQSIQSMQENMESLQNNHDSIAEMFRQAEERNQQLLREFHDMLSDSKSSAKRVTDVSVSPEQPLSGSTSASSSNGNIIESVLHKKSESSCRGNVIGKARHKRKVSGTSSRESVLGKSQRQCNGNLHRRSAPISRKLIETALHKRIASGSSSRENVLDKSPPKCSGTPHCNEPPISSPKSKSRRRRRRRRRRSQRWKRHRGTLSNKGAALAISHTPTPKHLVSHPDLLPMSTSCDRMKQQYQNATVMATALAKPPSKPIITEETTRREKPKSYLQVLTGTTTNTG